MASISKQKNGRYTVQFKALDGRRRSIRLGKISQKQANIIRMHVERLVAASITRQAVADDTSRWLVDLEKSNSTLLEKLSDVRLCQLPDSVASKSSGLRTLEGFLDAYISTFGPTVKEATVTTWRQARRLALEYFDPKVRIAEITDGHAVEFRNYLLTRSKPHIKGSERLSETTVRRRCGCLHQIFEHAMDLGLIAKNPFKSKRIPRTSPRPAPKFFLSPENAYRIMDQLPNPHWRLLFAFARWGGLRIPSEVQQLRWTDVDWERQRITVRSPKTEHHEGHGQRIIPLFPELVEPLRAVLDSAETIEERTWVLPKTKGKSGAALRKTLLAAIRRAGLEPWAKLYNALRATRDTELRELQPSHVVDAWIGHKEDVAKKNYLQVTDEHYARACRPQACSALHNPVHDPVATNRKTPQSQPSSTRKTWKIKPMAVFLASKNGGRVGDEGLEPPTSTV